MSELRLGPQDSLYYEYDPPSDPGMTFVFANAITGNTEMWQGIIGPTLRGHGYGTLAWNFRGQAHTEFAPGTALTPELVAGDFKRLLDAVAPPKPILVGLSIGGQFALHAHLLGAEAAAFVLINTLRMPGLRLEWINEGSFRAMRHGGAELLMDLMLPLIVNPEMLAKMRPARLTDAPYQPLDPASGHYGLMQHAGEADWDLPYERIDRPVLIMTGLHDRVFYNADDVAALTARLPDARTVVFEDAGHLIPAERPEATAQALLDFAAELA